MAARATPFRTSRPGSALRGPPVIDVSEEPCLMTSKGPVDPPPSLRWAWQPRARWMQRQRSRETAETRRTNTEPVPPPTAFVTQDLACVISHVPHPSASFPKQLPDTADSADLLWYPGVVAKPCRTYRTHLDAAQTARVLQAIKAVKRSAAGATSSCPPDDRSFVEVWFRSSTRGMPGASPTSAPTGCRRHACSPMHLDGSGDDLQRCGAPRPWSRR
ncbi:MAG: hypothetical protein JWP74_4213 [Marmoricola sp.]|nr:hypothetical protein [Marmoricola sp.]